MGCRIYQQMIAPTVLPFCVTALLSLRPVVAIRGLVTDFSIPMYFSTLCHSRFRYIIHVDPRGRP